MSEDPITLRDLQDQRWKDWFSRYESESELRAESIKTAQASLNARLDSMNEFRLQLKDQTNTLVTRSEQDAKNNSFDREISELRAGLAKISGGSETSKWMVGIGITVLLALVAFLMRKP